MISHIHIICDMYHHHFLVSAVIFAYRNEMDLCIGITVGSAVQIALFVLPGSVLIGWAMDRSMSLFFR